VTALFGAAILVARCRIEPRREGAPHDLDISGARRFEHALARPSSLGYAVDTRFQRAPTLEAVVAGDGQLGLVELRGRIARAELNEPMLGGVL
jgi:hypothetical protein